MPRWLKPPTSGAERDRLDRAAAAVVHGRVAAVNGTIRPEDQRRESGAVRVVMGKQELLALVNPSLGQSAAYAAVNTMQAQDFMVTLPDGTKATVPSSGGNWLETQRHDEAAQRRTARCAEFTEYGHRSPGPGKLKRGRPAKG